MITTGESTEVLDVVAVDKIVDDEFDNFIDEMIIDFVTEDMLVEDVNAIDDLVVVEDVLVVKDVVEDEDVVDKGVPSVADVMDGLVCDNNEVDFIVNIGVVVVVDVVRVLSAILSVIVRVLVTILLALELKKSASIIESVDEVDIDSAEVDSIDMDSVEVGLLTVSVFVLISK